MSNTDRYRVIDRETGEQIGMAVEDEAGIERRAELNPGHDYVNVRTGRIVETEATPVLADLADDTATTLARYGATPRPRLTDHSPTVAHAIEKLNDTAFVSKARLAELERLEARYAEIEAANRRLNESVAHLTARVTAANTLADVVSTTAEELEAITSGRDDKRVSRRARALALAVASYRTAR